MDFIFVNFENKISNVKMWEKDPHTAFFGGKENAFSTSFFVVSFVCCCQPVVILENTLALAPTFASYHRLGVLIVKFSKKKIMLCKEAQKSEILMCNTWVQKERATFCALLCKTRIIDFGETLCNDKDFASHRHSHEKSRVFHFITFT